MLVYAKEKEFHLHIRPGDVGRYVILPGDPGRCAAIAQHFEDAHLVAQNREYTTYTGTLCGVPVSVTSTGIGGPSAAIAMEELIHCGADTFIRVGTSGGMQPEVLGGHLVIATGAVRFEGTSKEYAPIEFPAVAHTDIVSALQSSAEELHVPYHVGVVQCKDSFYGQHSPEDMAQSDLLRSRWESWKRCGALASEMESAALFIVGSVRRVRVGTVLTALANQTRREMGLPDPKVYDTGLAIQAAVGALRRLIAKDSESPKE